MIMQSHIMDRPALLRCEEISESRTFPTQRCDYVILMTASLLGLTQVSVDSSRIASEMVMKNLLVSDT